MKRNDSALSRLAALPLACAFACSADPNVDATPEDLNAVTLAYTISGDMGYEVFPSAYMHVSGSPEAD